MKRTAFKPAFDAMEARISLSTTSGSSNPIADFFKNLFGQSTTSTTPKPELTPEQKHKIQLRRQHLREVRMEKIAAWHEAHSHPHGHAK